VELLL